MKIPYEAHKFNDDHLGVIHKADEILTEFYNAGITVTVRTLYYRFVALDLFPAYRKWRRVGNNKWVRDDENGTKNAEPNYTWLIGIISKARLAGLIDWEHLEDLGRNLRALQHYDGPQDALTKMTDWYHTDLWANQHWRPEVWIEKDALIGVIQAVCEENDVPYFSCRGYTSLTEMWRASLRLREHLKAEQEPFILHFGDHDPSGIDMSRDITHRLRDTFLADCEFERLALNMAQIEELQPPPNPAKVTDSRYKTYLAEFGDESWELDSLNPPMFRSLIEGTLAKLRDQQVWDADIAHKEEIRGQLKQVAQEWETLPENKKRIEELTLKVGSLVSDLDREQRTVKALRERVMDLNHKLRRKK